MQKLSSRALICLSNRGSGGGRAGADDCARTVPRQRIRYLVFLDVGGENTGSCARFALDADDFEKKILVKTSVFNERNEANRIDPYGDRR